LCFKCKIQKRAIRYSCFNYFRLSKAIMQYWLVKSEPSVYSFDQLMADKHTVWDGVRNYAARNHLRGMKKGDIVCFYHSNEGTEITGLARVSKEAFQDPSTTEEAWVAVEIRPYKKLKKPVPLSVIKKTKGLEQFPLVRIPRLSVMPVAEKEFAILMKLSGTTV
jgi:predicted RNA-binding protein with PUA-like domain